MSKEVDSRPAHSLMWRSVIASTSPTHWAGVAADHLDATLSDHAHCEKKAAISALSMLNAYPEDDELVRAMTALASEELGHFAEVYRVLRARGANLGRDFGDPYVQALLGNVRQPPAQRKIDRLLICALIEARSCERFRLLGEELGRRGDRNMAALFVRFANSEAGHAILFKGLAEREGSVDKRLGELSAVETAIVERMPVLPRIH